MNDLNNNNQEDYSQNNDGFNTNQQMNNDMNYNPQNNFNPQNNVIDAGYILRALLCKKDKNTNRFIISKTKTIPIAIFSFMCLFLALTLSYSEELVGLIIGLFFLFLPGLVIGFMIFRIIVRKPMEYYENPNQQNYYNPPEDNAHQETQSMADLEDAGLEDMNPDDTSMDNPAMDDTINAEEAAVDEATVENTDV